MPIDTIQLENAIRNALPVAHLEIEDQSSGCGENYAIILVSEVRPLYSHIEDQFDKLLITQAFEGKSTLARHRLSRI